MSHPVPENRQISPFLVFFIIHTMQQGIGILGFQRIIAMSAGHDGWISIIITGICIHILLWMMYKMLKITNGDFISIHAFILGEKAGKFISTFLILYFCILTVAVLRNYIEIVQVWMFPQLKTFWLALIFLILVVYIIFGGFRTVTGIAFFSIVLPTYIIFLFLFTLPYTDFTNLLPVFDHSVMDILKGSRDLSLTMLGFETLLFFYPFIKNPDKSQKWAQFGVIYTTLIALYLAIITFAYFPQAQLEKNIWPTLTLWKIIQLPFLERFEYIGIANWFIVILPNACISLWCASRLVKQIFSVRQRTTVPGLALLCLVGVCLLSTREQINLLTNITGKVGFYFNFVYIPVLFTATMIAKKVKRR